MGPIKLEEGKGLGESRERERVIEGGKGWQGQDERVSIKSGGAGGREGRPLMFGRIEI